MAMGASAVVLESGLYSYNPILTSITIGGMFFVPSYKLFFVFNTAACVFCTYL